MIRRIINSSWARALPGDGDDITIIATGLLVAEAVMAADALKDAGIHARVINYPHN